MHRQPLPPIHKEVLTVLCHQPMTLSDLADIFPYHTRKELNDALRDLRSWSLITRKSLTKDGALWGAL